MKVMNQTYFHETKNFRRLMYHGSIILFFDKKTNILTIDSHGYMYYPTTKQRINWFMNKVCPQAKFLRLNIEKHNTYLFEGTYTNSIAVYNYFDGIQFQVKNNKLKCINGYKNEDKLLEHTLSYYMYHIKYRPNSLIVKDTMPRNKSEIINMVKRNEISKELIETALIYNKFKRPKLLMEANARVAIALSVEKYLKYRLGSTYYNIIK